VGRESRRRCIWAAGIENFSGIRTSTPSVRRRATVEVGSEKVFTGRMEEESGGREPRIERAAVLSTGLFLERARNV
jgi:hypothetical protein